MATNESQFQNLGNGAYRVSGARVSPTTGRYVTGNAEANRATTPKSGSASATSSKTARKK